MLISTGKVSAREPWRILEVAIGQSPDILALRISKELKRLRVAAEALIPMLRNADGEPEWIVEHIYVRGLNGSLSKLASTPGIDFIRKEYAPQQWIQQLVSQDRGFHGIEPRLGDFVRVLAGPCARLCGKVTKVTNSKLSISIQMATKRVIVYTHPENVQQISCPADQQRFYYQSDLT